jgi:Sec-independent protein secretion pathway component TatC
MFYIKELFFRLKFCLFSFSITLFLCYLYKNVLLTILSFSLVTDSFNESNSVFNNFIYTHPIELLKINLYSALIISFVFIFLYIIWHIIDFLKSSLSLEENNNLVKLSLKLIFFIFIFNFFSFFILLPSIWKFFHQFGVNESINTPLNFFLELKIEEYFYFVLDFLYLINMLVFLFLTFYFLISYFGLSNIINWKKLFIFLNIVFATLLSPPDVYSQIFIFFILNFFFDVIVFINIYILKLNKMYKFLIRKHIKRN